MSAFVSFRVNKSWRFNQLVRYLLLLQRLYILPHWFTNSLMLSHQCHRMNLKLQWEMVRNNCCALCILCGWQKHTASLFLWFLAMKNCAWKCSFGGAQTFVQTQIFITMLAAKIIGGSCLPEQPVLSGWGQVSLIWFWCVLVRWYVH